jgi:nucleoside-diphosphate-sugar epimerase
MRILVVGGTGFIGLRVVQHLHNLGHDVTVFHRGRTASSLPEGVGEFWQEVITKNGVKLPRCRYGKKANNKPKTIVEEA